MTALDLITLALKMAGVIGVGQSISAEDSADALSILNMMLGQWQVKRWLVYGLQAQSLVSTGALSYTLGVGGDFNQPYTDHLESAYVRMLFGTSPQQPDFPLQIINSMEDWGRIRLKTLETWPQYVFYDAAYPLANVSFWPSPPAGLYEMFLVTKQQLSQLSGLAQTINLPLQYQEAILTNLSVRLRAAYGLPPDQIVLKLAADALNTLRNSNAQVPRLQMPATLTKGGWYNPFSDQP